MAKQQNGVPWDEIFEEFPDECKAELRAKSKLMCAKYRAILKFRVMKVLLREMLQTSTQLSSDDVRQFERNADTILSAFREAVEKKGGQIKLILSMPNEIEYNLFDLRDWYEELEGTPLGPFYEEEDQCETTEQDDRYEAAEQVLVSNE